MLAVGFIATQPASAVTASLDDTSPKAGNSAPDGIYNHRIRFNQLGQHNDVKLDVYMDTNTQKTLRINEVECFTNLNPGVDIDTRILRVTMVGATTITRDITARNMCDDPVNGLFRNYTLPLPRNNTMLQKFYVSVTIEYLSPGAYLNRTNTATDRNAIGFTANLVNSSTSKLAPVSTGGRNYSVLANRTGGNSSFRLPFALTCGTVADGSRKSIKIYDADVTELFGQLEAQIFKKGTDEAVPLFRNAETIGTIENGNKFIAGPGAGNRELTGFDFVPVSGQKYVLKISNLYNGNTIDVGMPPGMDTIYGAVACPGGYDLPVPAAYVSVTPVAAINKSDIEPGEQTSGLGYAAVENFPDLYAGDWPYNEVAVQRAANTGITATRVVYNTRQGEEAAFVDATKQIQCADGAYRAPVNCADLGTFQCADNNGRDTCGNYKWRCERTAAAGGGYNYFTSGSNTRGGISRPSNCRTADQYYDIQCADGVYRAPFNCADLGTFQCNDNTDRDSCNTYNWECSWNGDIRYINHGANTQAGMDNCRIYKYYCKDTNGNYITSGENYQYRTLSGLERPECQNQWDCPSPSPVRGFGSDDASAPCKIFRCYVPTDVSYGTWYEPDGLAEANKRCDFRCSSSAGVQGSGAHALLAQAGTNGKWGDGDLNCYYQPVFTIVCTISDGTNTATYTEPVTGNGNWCYRNVTVQGPSNIGGQVCVTTSVVSPVNGQAWPGPGRANSQPWLFSVAGPDSDCVTVVSKPTFKVFGGDVSAGSTFASDTCNNDFGNSSIVGWSGSATGYNGAHIDFAAYAPGYIYGAATSKKQIANEPKGLTFANTFGSGELFGGNYGPMRCITNHAGLKPLNTPAMPALISSPASGSYELNNANLNPGSTFTVLKGRQYIIYRTGDLYIDNNILYDRVGWATLEDIPALKVVVTGNIYIAPGVTELNGVFVAQPDSAGNGGRINTCNGIANADLFANCNQQLTVNGAFVAKRVILNRSFGTQRQGTTAEVFRYMPELWLTKWPQAGTSKSMRYDSMTNLAPIL